MGAAGSGGRGTWHSGKEGRRLEIRTLGAFEITLDGEPLRFGHKAPRKPLGLLKAIVALGNPAACRHRVADALWPDAEADAAHVAFDMTLHRLRKLLGRHEFVGLHEGRVSLDPLYCWVDVSAFEQLDHALASQCDAGADPHGTLLDVFAIYRGAFLSGDGDAFWTIHTRERLRDKFVRLVSRGCARLETSGRWDESLHLFHRAIEVDDRVEAFYQGVMRAALQLDRKAEGVAAFRRLQRTFPVLLGAAPSPDSERLYRQLHH